MNRTRDRNGLLLAILAVLLVSLTFPGVGLPAALGVLVTALVAIAITSRTPRGRMWMETMSTRWLAVAVGFATVAGLGRSVGQQWVSGEGWHRHIQRTQHRWYWGTRPVLAPSVVTADLPQRFQVRTQPGVEAVRVRLGEHPREAVRIGPGLHILDYDPDRDGPPRVGSKGTVEITVEVDGKTHRRRLGLGWQGPGFRWLTADDQQGLAAAVNFAEDRLLVVDRAGPRATFPTADGPIDVQLIEDRPEAWILHRNVPELHRVRLESGAILERLDVVADARHFSLSPDQTIAAITFAGVASGVQIVDLEHGRAYPPVALPFHADWIRFGVDEARLVISSARDQTLRRLRVTGDGAVVEDAPPLELGRPARHLIRGAGGEEVFLTASGCAPEASELMGNHQIEHLIVRVAVEPWRVSACRDTATRTGGQDAALGVDAGLDPMGLALADPQEAGSVLATFSGSGQLAVVDMNEVESLEFHDLANLGLFNPHGVVSLGGGILAVLDPIAKDLALRIPGDPVGGAEARWFRFGLEGAKEESAGAARQEVGRRFFYRATRGGISCQSCHLHGETDFARHNLGAWPATTGLIGGIDRSAPYFRFGLGHRRYNRVADIHEGLALTDMLGYAGTVPENVSREVETMVLTKARPFNPHWRTASGAEMTRGYGAFRKAGCAVCHPPPLFTNHSQHVESWLFPELENASAAAGAVVDVPSLLQVWRQPGYFHDRRAQSLEEVLAESVPPSRHGDVSRLREEEKSALRAFLKAL